MAKQRMPRRITIGGELYVMSVALLHTKDEHGRPALAKFIAEDHTVNLAGGEEFMIVYAPAHMLAKQPRTKD